MAKEEFSGPKDGYFSANGGKVISGNINAVWYE